MDDRTLFPVAPDAIHISLVYQYWDGAWTLRLVERRRLAGGELGLTEPVVYESLCSAEAVDVLEAELGHRLNL